MKDSKVQSIFDTLSLVLSSDDKKKLAEVSQAYFATVDENFSLREEISNLREKLIDKERQILDLNKKLNEKQKLKLVSNSGIPEYFIEYGEDERLGPVCPICYKKDNTSVILHTTSGNCAMCPNCKAKFTGVHAIIEGARAQVF